MKEEKKNLILIADDDNFVRAQVKEALNGLADIIEAESGEEAIELYQAKKPQILILDIHLPKENGKVILQKILKEDPSAYVIMFSADSKLQNVKETNLNGAKGFVAKPFTKEALLKYVLSCPAFGN